jgi:hypothetical protein
MVATMHFVPPAHWLPSVEAKLRYCSWLEFSSMILDRFGREQHELLVRQLLSIRQSGAVVEYIDKFDGLIDQLAAYEGLGDPLHYTMRFIDGLKEELRASILIQRPKDLDTAYILAQLQEDLLESCKRKDYRKPEFASKSCFKSNPPAPNPQARQHKLISAEDKRTTKATRAFSADDKWRSLRALRRSKGLCQYCAEKWSKDHKCAESVQFHVMHEVMELFNVEDEDDSSAEDNSSGNHLFLTLSIAAVSGLPTPKTLCLDGSIQGHQLRILVDSGSSHSFICDSMAAQLEGVSPLPSPMTVQVANGDKLNCVSQLTNTSWSVDGYEFNSNLKVLQLSACDMILGMDWLELHSPMKIHWKQKWLAIPYQNTTAILCGNKPEPPEGTVILVCAMETSVVDDKVSVSWTQEIQ